MLSSSEHDIIHCAPLHPTTIVTNIDKIESLTSIQRLFFNQFYHSICPQDSIPKILNFFLNNNVSSDHLPLHKLEMSSITSGYPIGQFIIDTYFQSVIHYNWTINSFMEKSALFSNIPKHNKTMTLIRSYLTQYLKLVAMPINIQLPQMSDDYSLTDDDEVDDTIQSNHFINYKHDMRQILYYLSQFNFSFPQYQRKVFRQIDAIFIPESAQINGELLRSNGIAYKELNMDRLSRICTCIEDLTKKDDFSKCIMLISAEKLYLFKIPIDNACRDILDYSELPWINNTQYNNYEWLKDIIQKYNGITFSYHIHSKDVQRVYCSYETIDNEYYSTRVFKHNIIDILKIFCNEIDNDIDDTVIDQIEFKDIQYDAFINTYFCDLKFESMQCYRMNELIKQYYENMGVSYNGNFINYMNENGFDSDEQLDNMFGKHINDYNDCNAIEFDKQFPIQQISLFTKSEDRYCFIFHFLQYCYLNNTIPTQQQIMSKYFNKIDNTACVPGGYNYRDEGAVSIIRYDKNNNNSDNSCNQKKKDNFNVKTLYRISRKLTKQIIPNTILEPIHNPYTFMIDKLCLLSIDNGIYQLQNGDRIVNFGFTNKTTNEVLYAYAYKIDPAINRSFQWSFDDILYTTANIKDKYGINDKQLPQPLILNDFNIPKLMNKDIKLLIDNTKSWAKINVYNIDSKVNKQTNKRKLTLSLTVEQFKNNLSKYFHSYGNNVANLIPILTLSKNKKYYMEYVWIITIENNIDIGISFKWQSDCKIVTGIYVNKQILLRRHMLLRLHDCHCLDNNFLSSSNISCLRIGNVCQDENKMKDLRQRNKKIKIENAGLQNVFSDLRVKMSNMKQELERLKALALKKQQSYINQNNNNKIGETTLLDEDKLSVSKPLPSISASVPLTSNILIPQFHPQYIYSFNGMNIVPMMAGNNSFLPNMPSFNPLPTNMYFPAPNAKKYQ